MSPFIVLGQLKKSFAGQPVLRGISAEIQEGEILVLLGPSGSGKTTLLRLIGGFDSPDAGEIRVAGEDVTSRPPEKRNFGMVFQHYALFPHMTVEDNVAFGLESRRRPADEISKRVSEVLEQVDLAGFEQRRVQEISGGQQQRVALARALAPDPGFLLLDEPLSNLDPDLRERTRRQLREAVHRIGITTIWVTHEQEEAFDVGDRIALLHDGELAQIGRPDDLYLQPASSFVASFVGRASSLPAVWQGDSSVQIGDKRYRGHGATWPAVGVGDPAEGETIELVVRPERLQMTSPDRAESLSGRVEEIRYTGEATFFLITLEIGAQLLVRGDLEGAKKDDRVGVGLRQAGPPLRAFRLASKESE